MGQGQGAIGRAKVVLHDVGQLLEVGSGAAADSTRFTIKDKKGNPKRCYWPVSESAVKNTSVDVMLQMLSQRLRFKFADENAAANEAAKNAPTATTVVMSEVARAIELIQGHVYEKPSACPGFAGLSTEVARALLASPRVGLTAVQDQYRQALAFARGNVTDVQRLRLMLLWGARARCRATRAIQALQTLIASFGGDTLFSP